MRPLKGTPASGLFGATLGFFVGFAAVALFGPTAHRFKEVMDLSPMMVGFLVAVPSLTGSLLRIPFSAWVDATGGRKPFLVLLSLSIVGMAGLTTIVTTLYPDRLTPNLYPLLLLLGCLCGCGIATFSAALVVALGAPVDWAAAVATLGGILGAAVECAVERQQLIRASQWAVLLRLSDGGA